MTDFIKNPKFHYWVKGGLCLRYLKDGLCDLVTMVMNRQHEKIRKDVGITPETICNTCELKTLKPHPCIPGPTPGCPEGNPDCTCKRNDYQECPKKICDRMKKAIIESMESESEKPNWKNINITRCQTSPWEIQKCFIKAPGYDEKTSADETDAAGLLLIISHNKYFREFVSCPTSHLKKIRDWRGSVLFHSGNMELEEHQLKSVIEDIKTVLQDEKELKSMECAKRALQNIEELETEPFRITTEHETDVIRDSISSIQHELKELDSRLQDLQKEKERTEERISSVEREESDLRQRVDYHDAKLQLLEERVAELEKLEKEKEGLIKLEKEQQALLKKIEDRKELRRSLADFFGKNYVKTSACPLKTRQNVIQIRDVYVEPDLKIKQEENEDQTNKTKKTPVTSYNELFERKKTRSKRIYILGDVGSGKSAFCQMLIHNWVKSVNGYCDIKENQNQMNATDVCTMMSSLKVDENIPEKSTSSYDNVKEMLKFEYLFYIPLRRLSGYSDICEMIKKYYEIVVPSEVLKDVLQNCPENCLVIMDGVDEWSPGQRDIQPEHETYGLPSVGDIKQATVLMTSRPSSPGILAMKSSESDHKILLEGIKDTKELVEKYYAKLKDLAKDHVTIETILSGLETVQICDLVKSPLLLKYIVWLLCMGSKVGGSVSEVYCNILNILLRWTDGKTTQNQSTDTDTDSNENMKHLSLPRLVEKHPSCKDKSMLIFTLGKIAFELLIQPKCSEMAFGRYTLKQKGISEELINILLQTGLLTEENRFDPTDEDTQFSFINTAFLEFMAALFIASQPGVQTDVLTDKTKSGHLEDVLKHLFRKFSSTEDILQLKNFLVLACGLAPHILQEICKHIYNITLKYTNDFENLIVSEYVENVVNFDFIPTLSRSVWIFNLTGLQNLVLNCLSEIRSNNNGLDLQDLRVPLATFVIFNLKISDISIINIDPLTVLHLFVFSPKPDDMLSFIDKFVNLQSIHVHRSKLQHNTVTLLCQLVSQTCLLRHIDFQLTECLDQEHECGQLVMDLSRHSELQLIHCMFTKMVNFENINTSNLEHCVTDRTDILRQVMQCRNLKTLMLCKVNILNETDFFRIKSK